MVINWVYEISFKLQIYIKRHCTITLPWSLALEQDVIQLTTEVRVELRDGSERPMSDDITGNYILNNLKDCHYHIIQYILYKIIYIYIKSAQLFFHHISDTIVSRPYFSTKMTIPKRVEDGVG